MRIFSAVRHAKDPKQFYGGLWSSNFHPALRALGHEIVESQVDLLPTSRFMEVADCFTSEELEVRARTTERILEEVRAALDRGPLDMFLSYFYNAHFDPAGFDELRRLGVPSVNFYCNGIHQFPMVAAIAAKVDVSWHPERNARASYLAVGANPVWVQMGADPVLCRPVKGMARQRKACFVGQRYADRDRWVGVLLKAAVPVDIYGAGWGQSSSEARGSAGAVREESHLGRKLYPPGSFESYSKALRETVACEGLISGVARVARQWKYAHEGRRLTSLLTRHAKGPAPEIAPVLATYEVCLNFSNVWADGRPGSRLIPHVRLRDFEGPMCRTCYLSGHTEEITEYYDVGREIDTYRDPGELVDKVRYYLDHPGRADELREAGYRRARGNHTWLNRFQQLFRETRLGSSMRARSGSPPTCAGYRVEPTPAEG